MTPDRGPALIVIPAYNEGRRLPALLEEVAGLLRGRGDVHVLVADDGSQRDESQAVEASVARAAESLGGGPQGPLRHERHERNRGKGAVLREAFAAHASGYEVLGFLDADGSTPFAEALRLLDLLRAHGDAWDACIGCRLKCLGIPVDRKVSRHAIGRVFATLVSSLFGIPVYDSQCGAKVFKASLLTPELLDLCDDDRWLFDTQLVISLWSRGARIRECPVAWHDVPGSKVSLLTDPPRMLAGLLRFRHRLSRWDRTTRARTRPAGHPGVPGEENRPPRESAERR